MKATVKTICGRYEVIGLREAERELSINNGKPTYEMTYLYSLGSKTYKTEKNAIKAIKKNGFEFISEDEINTVCGLD